MTLVDLVGSFVTYRLTRQHGRKRSESAQHDDDLVPSFSSAAGNTPAELHAAINGRSTNKQANEKRDQPVVYSDDWQLRAAARVMSLLFTANNATIARKPDGVLGQEAGSAAKPQGYRRGQIVPVSAFYNTLLDYSDLVTDFEAWESKSTKFSFCQYPFFLSIWAKIHILEHDARRQMEVKAREAFFNSILSRKAISQYLLLRVRRDCLVDDSLRSVSEVVGSSQEEIKKGLRIEFIGEEGVDAGGLRKEWFLLLVREIFDPHHAIYNSTILDINLPPFAFKKLLAAAPQTTGPQPATTRSTYKCSLDDLAEYRPALAKGLRALLDFEGDVAETFCYDFVAQMDRYGEVVAVPLCTGGDKRPVTNANRREFVDLYVHYLLDTAVTRQFEPFKRGFFTVCGGNALSLFRPEEIELLVRGSDEPLDVASLRAVATYDNWSDPRPEMVPVVQWFWNFFEHTQPQAQRKILSFITGSDRHETVGVVAAVGPKVKGFQVGERVVADNSELCGECFYCRRGDELFCEHFEAHGVTMNGGFAEYCAYPAGRVFKIKNLSDVDATLLEPASCAAHGLDKIAPKMGSSVLLFGAGPTGLILAQLLRQCGGCRVVVAAPEGLKLDLAKSLEAGDEYVALSRQDPSAQFEKLKKENPYGFDIVVEATGSVKILEDSINYVRRGGKLVVYGVYNNEARVSWPPSKIFGDEITIIGSFSETYKFPAAIDYLDSGKVKVKGIVNKVFKLEEWEQCLESMRNKSAIKAAITFD
ncbi:hypothetical protein APSETT445_002704 [Aspergillus pseudonomiae]